MKRRLFNVLAAVSLVLCVAMMALWMRSYFAIESMFRSQWNAPTRRLSEMEIGWERGLFMMSRRVMAIPAGFRPPPNLGWQHNLDCPSPRGSAVFWLWYGNHSPRSAFFGANGTLGWSEDWLIGVRLWPLAALLGVPCLARLAYTHRRRPAKGRCPICGTHKTGQL